MNRNRKGSNFIPFWIEFRVADGGNWNPKSTYEKYVVRFLSTAPLAEYEV